MTIQDVGISQTRRLPLLIIAPWSCSRWGTWGEPATTKAAERIERVYHGGSALPLSDTTPRLIVEQQTVPTVWIIGGTFFFIFLFLLCNYINNMFGVNLRELTGGGWKIHSFPFFFFFYLLRAFAFDCFQAVWCDHNSHKNTHSNNNRLITLIFHPSCLQQERSDAQLSRLIVSPILFKVQRRKWKHILSKNWEKVRKKTKPRQHKRVWTPFFFFVKPWFTASSVEATSRHQSTGREHDAVISANKPVHVVHHNDNIASHWMQLLSVLRQRIATCVYIYRCSHNVSLHFVCGVHIFKAISFWIGPKFHFYWCKMQMATVSPLPGKSMCLCIWLECINIKGRHHFFFFQ